MMPRTPLVEQAPRAIRAALRQQRREGVQSRRDIEEGEEIRDEFIENIRQQPNNRDFDVNNISQSSSHSSDSSPQIRSQSVSSILPPSLPLAHRSTPVNINAADERMIMNTVAQMRRSQSPSLSSAASVSSSSVSQPQRRSPELADALVRAMREGLQQQVENNKNDAYDNNNHENDEEHDEFVQIERQPYIPPRDVPSSAANRETMPPRSRSSVTPQPMMNTQQRQTGASNFTNSSQYDTSRSTSHTPGSFHSEQYLKNDELQRRLADMEQKYAHMMKTLEDERRQQKVKDEVLADLLKEKQKSKQQKEVMKQTMQADVRSLIRQAAHAASKIKPTTQKESDDSSSTTLPREEKGTISPLLVHSFPSLSPSTSPSFIVMKKESSSPVSPKVKKQEDDDEMKYDENHAKTEIGDKKNVKTKQSFGDLPSDASSSDDDSDEEELDCSDDERNIRRRDRKPDPIIKEPESEDETHLTSYPQWTIKRQILYPFESKKFEKLYTPRFSLLSENDRKNEWSRFGVQTHFHISLFGRTARRWFEATMQELGEPLLGAPTHRTRGIKSPTFGPPPMYFDERDEYEEQDDPSHYDLAEDSFTFGELPEPLRMLPVGYQYAQQHSLDLIAQVQQYAALRKMKRLARQPATPETKQVTQDMLDEKHACPRCKCDVYGVLKRFCSVCDELNKQEKERAIDDGWIPALDDRPSSSSAYVPSTSSPPVASAGAAGSSSNTKVKSESDFSVHLHQMNERANYSNIQMKVKKEPTKMSYHEQEEELVILSHKTKDSVRGPSSIDADKKEEDESPLGTVLSHVFLPHQRELQRRTRRDDVLGFRERKVAVTATVNILGKFDGSIEKAPTYLFDLCSQIQQYGHIEQDIISILKATMVGGARLWLDTNMYECFQLPYKPLQALLHRFRKQYTGAHVTTGLRRQLASTILTTSNPKDTDLDTHYATYQSLLARLRFSDQRVDEEETKIEFFSSLPESIKGWIGVGIDKALNMHDIYVMAKKAIMLRTKTNVRQDGDLPRTININAMPDGGKPKGKQEVERTRSRSPATTDDRNKNTALCYHCGKKGHYTGECRLSSQPQSLKGQQEYARMCTQRGWSYPYDHKWWVEQSKRFKANAQNNRSSSSSSRDRNQRPRKNKQNDKNTVTILDDAQSAEQIDVDDD